MEHLADYVVIGMLVVALAPLLIWALKEIFTDRTYPKDSFSKKR